MILGVGGVFGDTYEVCGIVCATPYASSHPVGDSLVVSAGTVGFVPGPKRTIDSSEIATVFCLSLSLVDFFDDDDE